PSQASAPERSTIFPPDCFAAPKFAFVNAGDPVKNTNRAFSKLPSSTGWMTVGSPPASVSVPAASSSSNNRKSQPANLLSSSSVFSSAPRRDRKSTRLNSSHRTISYAVFCLKKKNSIQIDQYI